MCEAIKQMIAAGKAEGRKEGRVEGLELASAMIADGRADEVARLCSDRLFLNEMKKRYGFKRSR